MTERGNLPGIKGYDFDEDTSMPMSQPPTDYDLFGMNDKGSVDILQADRTNEQMFMGDAVLPTDINDLEAMSQQRAERMVRSLGKNVGIYTTYKPTSAAAFVRDRSKRFKDAMGDAARGDRNA